MRKAKGVGRWNLVGTVGEGTLCHKPCTVSGGGKSEISKSIQDAMIQVMIDLKSLIRDSQLKVLIAQVVIIRTLPTGTTY
jgi:hypothetical protein